MLNKAQKIFKESLSTVTDSYRKNRDSFRTFFRRHVYKVVLVPLILGTVYIPRYQGEQDAQDLLYSQQNEGDAPDSSISWIDRMDSSLSPVYPALRNHSLTVTIFGKQDSQPKRPIRVTIRHDAAHPKTLLPKPTHTFLLGTTSSFHFFYECEEALKAENGPFALVREREWSALEEALKAENGPFALVRAHERSALEEALEAWGSVQWNTVKEARPKCVNGRPFIIPTANIASLEFNPSPGTTAARPELQNPPLSPKNGKPDGTGEQPKQQQCQWEKGFEVTRFGIGEEVLPAFRIEEIEKSVAGMRRSKNNQTLQKLRLIGRADITPFQQGSSESCDLNDCLALARARWMRGEIPTNEFQTQTIIEIAGPQCIDPKVSGCDPALDRSVEVYACWASNDSEQANMPANPPG